MSGHAKLAPSHTETWFNCTGSLALCEREGLVSESSVYADEGTAAHAVGSARLSGQSDFDALLALKSFYTDDEKYAAALEHVQTYVNAVRNASAGKVLLVEQRLSVEKWTTEEGGKGTSDAIIVDTDSHDIEVWDLKFGEGNIVFAERNKQLMIYALGALGLVEMIYGPVKSIKLVICQPRRDHMSEWTVSREELIAFGDQCQLQGAIALSLLQAVKEKRPAAVEQHLSPSAEACLWCPAKKSGKCPAIDKLVRDTAFEEFTVVDDKEVSAVTRKIENNFDIPSEDTLDLIADWVKAKREWIKARVHSGIETPGWKLVLGDQGDRKFTDLVEVERLLKSLKFKKDQMYTTKLIPLTKIEKLVPKPKWPVFANLIIRAPAQPIAVGEKDKRPVYSPKATADEFQNEEVNFDAFK